MGLFRVEDLIVGTFVNLGQSTTKATTRLRANADKKMAKAVSSYKDTLFHKARSGIRTLHHYHPKDKSSRSFYGAGRLN